MSNTITLPNGRRLRIKHSRALIRLDKRVDMTPSGLLHIPETAQRQSPTATVMAIGDGGRWCPKRIGPDKVDRGEWHWRASEVRVGDVVVIGAYNGVRIDEAMHIDDGHQWWIVETLPEVGMDWNEHHLGDVYAIQKRNGEE